MELLTREQSREQVFERDNGKCVICHQPAQDSHHIMERRLFPDGGYYINNLVSLCAEHHVAAETTTLSPEELRAAAGILEIVLPPHLYDDEIYTKWGDGVRPDGMRTKGELFYDESVQKILERGGVLDLYLPYVKYPRTFHLPDSPNALLAKDDKILKDYSQFLGQEIVASVKYDGENATLYDDYYHARSINMPSHPSQTWLKNFHANMKYNIPRGWRLCCENMFAKHSIHYHNLPSYILLFSIWNEQNECLSWDDTLEWSELLNIPVVKQLYRGIWDEDILKRLCPTNIDGDECEGFVVRNVKSFPYKMFRNNTGKWVRQGHVPEHAINWRSGPIIKNELRSK